MDEFQSKANMSDDSGSLEAKVMEELHTADLQYRERQRNLYKQTKVVAHTKHLKELGNTRQNRASRLIDSALGFHAKSIGMFIAEIPPGKHTGKHRHNNEAIIWILSGKGYSIVEDARHEWGESDAVFVPSNAWHQHFNSSESDPVRYLGFTNAPALRAIGIKSSEQAEDKDYE